jgi:hypothetical protein
MPDDTEADPTVTAFRERPGFIQSEGSRYLRDFWVRYFDRQELIILFDSPSECLQDLKYLSFVRG